MSAREPSPEPRLTREEELRAITVGELRPLSGPVELVDYDPAWPARFEAQAARIRAAIGDAALRIEHCGSTSVAGLAAKPVIDIVLVVVDTRDELAYVAPLEAAGYTLRIREPDWYEHRMLRGADPAVNLHVFPVGCEEIDRMVAFRDWLRSHDDDRLAYERAKRALTEQPWTYMQHYADAKSTSSSRSWPAPRLTAAPRGSVGRVTAHPSQELRSVARVVTRAARSSTEGAAASR